MLTHGRLVEVLDYNPTTGEFHWKVDRKGPGAKVGRLAGSSHKSGYWRIKIDGVYYRAHRLAWLHVNGAWPSREIDHINGVRGDNRIANLRDVDHMINCRNKNTPARHNKCGFIGVSYQPDRTSPKKYQAKIRREDKTHFIGYYTTPEEAHAAYLVARTKVDGTESVGGRDHMRIHLAQSGEKAA